MRGYYDFADHGGIADFNPDTGIGTDNTPTFMALLDLIRAEGNKHAKILMDGWFYFEDTIVITQTVGIEGTGMAEPPPFATASRSAPGTLLVFPKNVTGVRIRSASGLDLPGPPTASGERTSIKDLTIWCKELHDTGDPDTLGDGVYSTVVYSLENVNIQSFAGHGVHNRGSYLVTGDGNVSCSLFLNVVVGGCGVDGFHSEGADATIMTFVNCTAAVNRRYGVYDEARMNCYVGMHCEGNGGAGLPPPLIAPIGADYGSEYHTEGEHHNTSTFLGCYHEDCYPGHESVFNSPANIIGGTFGESIISKDSICFVQFSGVATRKPYVYENNRGVTRVQSFLGEQTGTDLVALKWVTPDAPYTDYSQLVFDPSMNCWTLKNGFSHRNPIRFPTLNSHWRQAAPQFPHGIFLGGDAGDWTDPISIIAAPREQTNEYAGSHLTCLRGDIVLQSHPVAGGEIGRRYLTSGTHGVLNGGATLASTVADKTSVFVSTEAELQVGQLISIAGVTGTKRITSIVLHHAKIESGKAAPYALADGQTLTVKVDGGAPQTVTFATEDFERIGAATAEEVAAVINSATRGLAGAGATPTSGGKQVTITSQVSSVGSHIEVAGGTANAAFAFSTVAVDGSAEVAIDTPADATVSFATVPAPVVSFVQPTFESFGGTTIPSPTITGTVTYQGAKLRILSIPGEAQTAAAGAVVIAQFAMRDDTSVTFDFRASMKAVGAVAKSGRWDGKVTYDCTGSGAVTICGAAEYRTPQTIVAGDSVVFDLNGRTLRVLATADDADVRNWTCELRVHETVAT